MSNVRPSQPTVAEPLTRGERIKHLRLSLAGPMQEFISQGRFGELVATEQGRPKAYDTSTAKRWEDGAAPEIPAIEAMARLARRRGLLYITRTWLAFGDDGVTEAKDAPAVPFIERREEAEEPTTKSGAPRMKQHRQSQPGQILKGTRRR